MIPISMAIHERNDHDGTIWGSFSAMNFEEQRFYQVHIFCNSKFSAFLDQSIQTIFSHEDYRLLVYLDVFVCLVYRGSRVAILAPPVLSTPIAKKEQPGTKTTTINRGAYFLWISLEFQGIFTVDRNGVRRVVGLYDYGVWDTNACGPNDEYIGRCYVLLLS